ncbi:hypothetical protein Peur_001232 [Populus x canadensis]|jgi:hypothetical protein
MSRKMERERTEKADVRMMPARIEARLSHKKTKLASGCLWLYVNINRFLSFKIKVTWDESIFVSSAEGLIDVFIAISSVNSS